MDMMEKKLSYIFKVYGEEKYHRRIANKIVESRKLNKISTTHDLVKLIDDVIPKFEIKREDIYLKSFSSIENRS